MKREYKLLVFIAAVILLVAMGWRTAHAQTPTTLQLTGTGSHTTCAVVPLTTNYCFANDGLWQSLNGGPYTQLGAGSSGVISFNGRTGAVVPVPSDYPSAVTSVNGKTGAVVIGATTTAATTLQ